MKAYKRELTIEDKLQQMYNDFVIEHACHPDTIELTTNEYKELDEAGMIANVKGTNYVLTMKVVKVLEYKPQPVVDPKSCTDCKHQKVSAFHNPCSSCKYIISHFNSEFNGTDNWEPKAGGHNEK